MVASPTRLKVVMGLLAAVVIAAASLLVVANLLINVSTENYLYSDIDKLPANKVGLLLGTSKYSRTGGNNDHYRLRVDAASKLFKAGKIQYVLISGDNATPYYNEPSTIRRDLLKLGIPAENIYRDYAGFRTLDSIIRAKDVFGLNEFTIISQTYHNKRALYIARNNGTNAIAFNAGDGRNSDLTNRTREVLARMLALLEVHWFDTEPKYLGPVIDIGNTPPT
ncbi:vancomycin high temperature exclusion protein [Endozoicomonas montiporae]|uniref:SanA protein n=1 Tax=Endozoicomonas montiporae CL-33 TaxID=570277 RepID=A0A142BGC7_9GAMM|nr:ElyC/SanA/YdcF family protein [Endozoicomonas montiporae]AMO57803.1 SanA protein [Endozoicomonas montiporae CL-33]